MIKHFQNQLNRIEYLLNSVKQKEAEFIDIEEASTFLKLKKATIYQLVFKREIPFYKNTRKLLFKKSDLIEWVEKDRVYSIKELELQLNQKIN